MGATGWASGAGQLSGSDFLDRHDYSPAGPAAYTQADTRGLYISTAGEMGGISLYVPMHTQYPTFYGPSRVARVSDPAQWLRLLDDQVSAMIQQAQDPTIGLSAAVFTETTDVQYDITGLITYDRFVIKVNATAVALAVSSLVDSLG